MKYLAPLLVLLVLPLALASTHGAYSEPRQGFSASTSISVQDTAVYNTGYVSENGSNWTEFSLTGDNQRGDWVLYSASADISLSDIRYVAVFSCTWNEAWDCSETWQVRDRGEQETPPPQETSGLDSKEGDEQALRDLYEHTNGDGWTHTDGWYGGEVVLQLGDYDDEPVGVKVEEIDGELRVTGINMQAVKYTEGPYQGNNLEGTLPESLGNLKQLTDRFNVKQNKLSGEIPASIWSNWTNLKRLSLAGQFGEIDLDHRTTWFESNHNHCVGSCGLSGKTFTETNAFTGTIPPEIRHLQALQLLEIRRQFLQGTLPKEIGELTQLRGLFLNSQQPSSERNITPEDVLGGALPDGWAGLVNLEWIALNNERGIPGYTGGVPREWENWPSIRSIQLGGNQLQGVREADGTITAQAPIFPQASEIHYVSLTSNDFTGEFPIDYFSGRNSRLNKFTIAFNDFSGEIPEIDTPITQPDEQEYYRYMGDINLGWNDFTGPIPQWIAEMDRLILTEFRGNNFTGPVPEAFVQSPRLRHLRLSGNTLSGEIPDFPFAPVVFEGEVVQQLSDDTLQIDLDLGIVETGTITSSSSDWINDRDKRGAWDEPWNNHLVTIDPQGRNIAFEVRESTNYATGYLYARDQADTSGTTGLPYEIRPAINNRIIRFETAPNRWITRNIVSVDYDANTITLDTALDTSVTGLRYNMHVQESGTAWILLSGNNLTGPIPQSWQYIPSNRDLEIHVQSNKLSGIIPDLSQAAAQTGGSVQEFYYDDNNFVFSDIVPNFAANQDIADHRYAPQKPFGQVATRSVNTRGSITLDDFSTVVTHADNSYQWHKDGAALDGATRRELTISDAQQSDAGTYTLHVTNPNIPELTLRSEPIEVTVT